jgi:hypothetical protein
LGCRDRRVAVEGLLGQKALKIGSRKQTGQGGPAVQEVEIMRISVKDWPQTLSEK